MPNPEHLEILTKGVEVWNKWREENIEIIPDFSNGDRSQEEMTDIQPPDLSGADLRGANLRGADLHFADLYFADLRGADLRGANLSVANLHFADLHFADLRVADICVADLRVANLRVADLRGADLRGADLSYTAFGYTDLRKAKNLDQCKHKGPSFIDQMTLVKSGKLPESFLRGCGLSDEFIEQIPFLFWEKQAFEFYSCFISYSSKDEDFARRLHADLQSEGVRCWFAPEDMKIGDKIRQRIDESIRIYDKLLLILSENSINSTWVEKEVETAFEKEQRNNHLVLFPVRLDNGVMGTDTSWAADIRSTRHIGDFTRWKDHDAYQEGFKRLLRDLREDKKLDE